MLVAILVVMQPARTPPRRIPCQSHLKQIALATQMYCQDYDEVLPPSCLPGPAAASPADHVAAVTWDELLMPYLKNTEVLHCPMEPRLLPARTYAANAWMMGTGYCHPGWVRGAPRYGRPLKSIPSPADTILYAERWDRSALRVMGRAEYHFTWDDPGLFNADHQGGGNCAFVDGHVKWLTYPQTVTQFRWR